MTCLFGKDAWWIKFGGFIIHCKRTPMLFSERYGYEKFTRLPFSDYRIRFERENNK